MRIYAPLLAASLFALPAFAQTAPAPAATPAPAVTAPVAPEAAPAPSHHAKRETLKERFEAANTTHDGHLTLEQAKAGMPRVAKHFSDIDKDHKGYVTLEEIHDYAVSMRHTHHTSG